MNMDCHSAIRIFSTCIWFAVKALKSLLSLVPLLLLLLPEPPHQATTNLLPLRPVPPWPTPTLPTPPSFRPLSLHPRLKGKILAKCLNQIEGTWTQGHPGHAHSVHSAADAWLFLSPSLSSLQASFHGSSSHSSQS